jgi:hypothetical protein
MDISKKMLKFTILLGMIAFVITQKCKNTYTCSSLEPNVCWAENNSTVTLNPCSTGFHCPIDSADTKKTCVQDVTTKVKLYPGSNCTTGDDCFSANCDATSKLCVGVKAGEVCQDHGDCAFGQACYITVNNKTCQAFKGDGAACDSSYECPRTHGCLNSNCTAYFSSKEGVNVTEEASFPHLSFCSSGKSVEGVCHTLDLQTPKCTDTNTCGYKLEDGTTKNIDANCACGFNKDTEKYCKQGTTSQVSKDAFDSIKQFLTLPNCHTLERNEQCNYYKKFPEDISKKYKNTNILNDKSNVLANADKCVLAVAFPDYDGSVDPEPPVANPKCARYACEKNTENICALGHYNNTLQYSHVSLNDICNTTQVCTTSTPDPFIEFTATTDKDVKGSCTDKPKNIYKSFPGEACTADADCYADAALPITGKCVSKVCAGSKVGEVCTLDQHCVVGNYCESGKCAAQKNENDPCKTDFECGNTLLCFENKCQKKYFSVATGTIAAEDFLCQTGKRNANNECSSYKSNGTKNSTEANLVRCQFGSKCTYTDNKNNTLTEDCACGYNSEGVGYCPRDDDDSKYF